MEAAEKISVGVIKEKTKSKAVKKEAEGMRVSTREKVCYGVGDIGANNGSFIPDDLLYRCGRNCSRSSRNPDADRKIV